MATYGFARCETRGRCFNSGNTHCDFDLAHLLELAKGEVLGREMSRTCYKAVPL